MSALDPPYVEHRHDIEWRVTMKQAQSTCVRFTLRCGCGVQDTATFVRWTREQLGWEVRTTKGCGGSYSKAAGALPEYYCWVATKSLRADVRK